ncbi:MAG TPA: YceH family protein [Pirellulales bacterium]|nr:YceH family protein [Pirellulales bacterium]
MNEHTAAPATESTAPSPPRWKPLGRIDRRVVGVLVEKAKTTPDQYPMTMNGLINGCNQKSNRDPQMQLEEADISDSLDRLKGVGAAIEVQGSGRVPKYRHLLYEWLGVSKMELAVMTELLLRGAQTEGELRSRAARMEPIADLNALREILQSLRAKRLVIDLTPPGRGQIISHNLYEPDELQRLKEKLPSGSYEPEAHSAPPTPASSTGSAARSAPARSAPASSAPAGSAPAGSASDEWQSLRSELAELRHELEALMETVRQQEREIADLRSSLGG